MTTAVRRPGLRDRPARALAAYLLGSAALLGVYVAVTTVLWLNRDFADEGPLSFHRPSATQPLDPSTSLTTIGSQCRRVGDLTGGSSLKIVAARVDGQAYYARYLVKSDGSVFKATVVDSAGVRAPDSVIKKAGAWRWIGTVKTPTELVLGGVGLVAVLGLYLAYYRRPRPGPPRPPGAWWRSRGGNAALGLLVVQPLTLPFRRRESRARRMRLLYEYGFGWIALVLGSLLVDSRSDALGWGTLGMLACAQVAGWLGGRALLRPPGFDVPDGAPVFPVMGAPPPFPVASGGVPPDSRYAAAPPVPAGRPARRRAFPITPAGQLPTFADVGGMQQLKDEVGDTFGRLLAFSNEAEAYRISFNGVLLHGPAGVGKTFIARATAGEFGLNFLSVSTADLVSKFVGESARNVAAVFAEAARSIPCLLFFDEFDAVAQRRDDSVNEESKRVVNQLLRSLEEWRGVRELVIMAATNYLDQLDPAVVRPGRFDRHIRVDLPDRAARLAILHSQLTNRPVTPGLDLDDIAGRTAGRTPATIVRVVEGAALAAFRAATESGGPVPITNAHLRAALDALGGTDRPTVEDWTWDRLVLAESTRNELRQVAALVKDPDLAAAYGVQPPSGLLLAGPPGTGKTTIAKVFAAESGCSFYPQSAADLTSKWVGESEASVVRLFARARENAPSIIFLDEVDALAARRGDSGGSYLDRTLTQLLTEIDGISEQRGVFVMAATNRPELLDPALTRGGRLSRTVVMPLPDAGQRLELLRLFCRAMPLVDVDLTVVAARTAGRSGADLEALCQQASMHAMIARQQTGSGAAAVTQPDFDAAIAVTPTPPPDDRPADDQPAGGYL